MVGIFDHRAHFIGTQEADAQLRQMWEDGTSVADIAQHFGRKQSAIIVRIKKLGI